MYSTYENERIKSLNYFSTEIQYQPNDDENERRSDP